MTVSTAGSRWAARNSSQSMLRLHRVDARVHEPPHEVVHPALHLAWPPAVPGPRRSPGPRADAAGRTGSPAPGPARPPAAGPRGCAPAARPASRNRPRSFANSSSRAGSTFRLDGLERDGVLDQGARPAPRPRGSSGNVIVNVRRSPGRISMISASKPGGFTGLPISTDTSVCDSGSRARPLARRIGLAEDPPHDIHRQHVARPGAPVLDRLEPRVRSRSRSRVLSTASSATSMRASPQREGRRSRPDRPAARSRRPP